MSTTADEIRALKRYVEIFPKVKRVIIVSSAYHTRRAGYTAKRMLWTSGVDVEMSGVENPDWKMQGWWLVGAGRREIWGEYKKMLYYVPRYALGF